MTTYKTKGIIATTVCIREYQGIKKPNNASTKYANSNQ